MQTSAAAIGALMDRARLTLGEDPAAVRTALSELFEELVPQTGLSDAELASAVIQGVATQPQFLGALQLAARTFPSLAMALGAAHAVPIPASGPVTFEIRHRPAPDAPDEAVLGRVTVDASAPLVLPAPTDTDGNLLDDDGERLFLGGLGSDPFAGLGSGYTLLQAFFDGADPWLSGSFAKLPPAHLAPPAVQLGIVNPTTVELRWQFPPAYLPRLDFKLQGVPALGGSWANLPATLEDLRGDNYRMRASVPGGNTAFWRLTMRLR